MVVLDSRIAEDHELLKGQPSQRERSELQGKARVAENIRQISDGLSVAKCDHHTRAPSFVTLGEKLRIHLRDGSRQKAALPQWLRDRAQRFGSLLTEDLDRPIGS